MASAAGRSHNGGARKEGNMLGIKVKAGGEAIALLKKDHHEQEKANEQIQDDDR